MSYLPFSRTSLERRDVRGPLVPYLRGFALHLRDQGYSLWTSGYYFGVAKDLSAWLDHRRLRLRQLSQKALAEYLRFRKQRVLQRAEDRAGLCRLVEFLSQVRALPTVGIRVVDIQVDGSRNTGYERPPAGERVLDLRKFSRVERQYEQYLARERGLLPSTREDYLRYVTRFLSERNRRDSTSIRRLSGDDVTAYVVKHVGDHGRGSAKAMAKALRSFLRFLYIRGRTRIDLSLGVPTVPNWRLATVPKYISQDEVRALLATCDRASSRGKRDYAILLTLARLGLRAGEVASLTLEGVDWRAGEMSVTGKGGRKGTLPIPVDVGRALVDYVRHGRPKCKSRRLFIRNIGPWTGFTNAGSVSTVVRRALRVAGLKPPRSGAHVLRHTLATRLLARGASLPEIAEVLRHGHPDTSTIYAKVDINRLRAAAPEWPKGAR